MKALESHTLVKGTLSVLKSAKHVLTECLHVKSLEWEKEFRLSWRNTSSSNRLWLFYSTGEKLWLHCKCHIFIYDHFSEMNIKLTFPVCVFLFSVSGWVRICTKQGGTLPLHLWDRLHLSGAVTGKWHTCLCALPACPALRPSLSAIITKDNSQQIKAHFKSHQLVGWLLICAVNDNAYFIALRVCVRTLHCTLSAW